MTDCKRAEPHAQTIWVVLDKSGNWLCDVADEASAQMVADALNLHDSTREATDD
jgi:hypothetical protein